MQGLCVFELAALLLTVALRINHVNRRKIPSISVGGRCNINESLMFHRAKKTTYEKSAISTVMALNALQAKGLFQLSSKAIISRLGY